MSLREEKVKLLKCLESELNVIVCDLQFATFLSSSFSGKSHEFNYDYITLPLITFPV